MEVLTYGCAMNQAESEIMSGLLEDRGLEGQDVTVVNTCTVKTPTENKVIRLLRQLEGEGRKVVVAGCLPPARPEIIREFPSFSFIGVNTEDIVEAVSAAASGKRYVKVVDSKDKSLMPRTRVNPVVGILPVAQGCLGRCSYCQTKLARGNLYSYPHEKLKTEARQMIVDGVKELWVTGQDTGAYGLDTGVNICDLLKDITDIPGDFKVRVGMMNPNHAIKILDELLEVYDNRKIYKFLHLPVQSGDDNVLADMRRQYSVEDYNTIIRAFQELNVTISTDIIAGYPTEDENAFQNSVKLVKETKPDILNVTRYWPRPKTKAARLKQHPGRETKRRSRILNEVFKEVGLERNRKWIGWKGPALISQTNVDGTYTARNNWYKPIVIKEGKLGEAVDVGVTECTYYDLRGNTIMRD